MSVFGSTLGGGYHFFLVIASFRFRCLHGRLCRPLLVDCPQVVDNVIVDINKWTFYPPGLDLIAFIRVLSNESLARTESVTFLTFEKKKKL